MNVMETGLFVATIEAADDDAFVRTPAFDGGRSSLAVTWQPRVDDTGDPVYPQAGDIAWLQESDEGEWVVLMWRPRTPGDDI